MYLDPISWLFSSVFDLVTENSTIYINFHTFAQVNIHGLYDVDAYSLAF